MAYTIEQEQKQVFLLVKKGLEEGLTQEEYREYARLQKKLEKEKDTIEDGLGSVWSAYCAQCGKKSMFVNRPGDARCENCG